MTPEEYFGDWYPHIDTKALNTALTYVRSEQFLPSADKVFRAFTMCKAADIQVIMMGQDVYPQPGVATGIAFANSKETKEDKLSPSLQVIKEAAVDYTVPHKVLHFDNTLESWARQGVLMLNSSLTVKPYAPGTHSLYWRPVISHLLGSFSLKYPGNVYVLFGKQAQSFKRYIHSAYNIIEVEHPAALARKHEKLPARLFRQISEDVFRTTGKQIKWYEEEEYGEF